MRPLELHCTATDDVLLARYAARAGTRHHRHLDVERMPEIASAVSAGRYGPLGLNDEDLVVVDTTSFDDVDVDALLQAARDHLGAGFAGPAR